jgi:hypothetical protein
MRTERPDRRAGRKEDRAQRDPEFTTGKYRDVSRRRGPGRLRTTGDYHAARTTDAYSSLDDSQDDSPRSDARSPRRLRSSWALAILATVAVTASLIFVAWAKMQTVQHTYKIDELIDSEEELANRQRILRSELAALRSPAKLHALAPGLGLAPPKPGHVVVITGDPEGLTAALAEGEDSLESSGSAADEETIR